MTSNRYAPPSSAVADPVEVPIARPIQPGVAAFERAPATLIGLLFFVLAGRTILAVVSAGGVGPYVVACLQILVFGFICWKAVTGSKGAAFLLATLLFLGALVTIVQLVLAVRPGGGLVAIVGAWAFILILAGAYVSFSPAVRKFYSQISDISPTDGA